MPPQTVTRTLVKETEDPPVRLAKTDIIAGLDAPVVRDLMRRLRTPGDTDYLRSRLPGGVDAAAVADQLFAEGFLEPAKGHPAGPAW